MYNMFVASEARIRFLPPFVILVIYMAFMRNTFLCAVFY